MQSHIARRFSVVIATYNRRDYVCKTIDSVLAQTFNDYEIIVADDGSTDGTADMLKSVYGTRIRLVHHVNQGSERTYQFGASFASGQYLAFLDSDDLFLPYTLMTYDKIIRTLDSPPVILGSMISFQEDLYDPPDAGNMDCIEVLKYRDYLSRDISIGLAQSRIVLKRAVFEEANRLRGRTEPYILNDYRLMLLVGTYGPCVITKRPITVAYRQHGDQGSKKVGKMGDGVLQLIRAVRRREATAGQPRPFLEYAFLAGPIYEWCRKAIKSHRVWQALRLAMAGWPMVAVGATKKLWSRFHRVTSPIIIPYDQR